VVVQGGVPARPSAAAEEGSRKGSIFSFPCIHNGPSGPVEYAKIRAEIKQTGTGWSVKPLEIVRNPLGTAKSPLPESARTSMEEVGSRVRPGRTSELSRLPLGEASHTLPMDAGVWLLVRAVKKNGRHYIVCKTGRIDPHRLSIGFP
jgi:hypothetical protein